MQHKKAECTFLFSLPDFRLQKVLKGEGCLLFKLKPAIFESQLGSGGESLTIQVGTSISGAFQVKLLTWNRGNLDIQVQM